MPAVDPRVDRYIAKSAPFARPILTHLRRTVHAACPDVQETIKWGVPHFEFHGLLCSMAAFKAHAAFGFWKGTLVTGRAGASDAAFGGFGRITSLADLPARTALARYVKKAAALNASGVKLVRPRRPRTVASHRVPTDLAAGLRSKAKARKFFNGLPPSQKAEYIEWIIEAKRPETRATRLATTLAWLGQGKIRHWKYAK